MKQRISLTKTYMVQYFSCSFRQGELPDSGTILLGLLSMDTPSITYLKSTVLIQTPLFRNVSIFHVVAEPKPVFDLRNPKECIPLAVLSRKTAPPTEAGWDLTLARGASSTNTTKRCESGHLCFNASQASGCPPGLLYSSSPRLSS
jgi:hypothetical protein